MRKGCEETKVQDCYFAGLKSFVADQMCKHTKYVNEQVFDDWSYLVESCYVFFAYGWQKLVGMCKNHTSVFKTLVGGKFHS